MFVLAAFGWGLGLYGPPIYLHTVRETRGWSLALVSTAVTVHFLFGAIVIANMPKLYKKFGVAAVTKAGSIALATGITGWAIAQQPWQLFLTTLLSGGGWVTMGAAAVNAIISPWFVRTRPVALATTYNGSSIGGVVFSPLWVAAIGLLGFPGAAVAIGLVMVVTIWVLADLFYARTPEQMGLVADGDAPGVPSVCQLCHCLPSRSQATRCGRTGASSRWPLAWRLASSRKSECWRICSRCLFRRLAHNLLAFQPVRPRQPRLPDARSLDGSCPLVPTGGSLPAQAISCRSQGRWHSLLAAGDHVPLLLLGVVLFGFGIGNATSLPPLIAQVEFVKEDVPRVVPMIVAIGQGTYAFAPSAFGLIREFAPNWER